MDKQKALTILNSIYRDHYEEWRIPHYVQYCEKEITLPNGEQGTLVAEDGVWDFIDYVRKLIENDQQTHIQTSAGKITTRFYDDGIAKGVQIHLNDEIVAMLDVYEDEPEGEARVLVYCNSDDEPTHCISINR